MLTHDEALEAQVHEKMRFLQQAMDDPDEEKPQEKPTTGHAAAESKPLESMADSNQSIRVHDDIPPLDEITAHFNTAPEIIVIDDDDDVEPEMEDDVNDSAPPPLDEILSEFLLAMCKIQDAVNCVHLNQCRDPSCVEMSQHLEHASNGTECPSDNAICDSFSSLVQHVDSCSNAATCALCLRVQLRRLQYKLVALDYALLTLPPTIASSPASVINFQANSRQSLSIRKQTCEVELKECMEKVRRLRLPTFELPPVANHFHPLTMPTFKRLHDPISVYLFKCEPNVPYWTQLVIHGRQIVNAHICRIAPLCLLECQKWKEIIVRHNTKAGPSTWENTVIANHKLHCRLCTFPQCVYCTSMRLCVMESRQSMARTLLSRMEKHMQNGNPQKRQLNAAKYADTLSFLHKVNKQVRWYHQVLPLWSRPHTPVIQSTKDHYKL
ncbi:hypothetical protein LEN26_018358 [Aphanomyces euteiches]|nr:hypothetical protein LEN26_018358 [Aphanomyces euteiches]